MKVIIFLLAIATPFTISACGGQEEVVLPVQEPVAQTTTTTVATTTTQPSQTVRSVRTVWHSNLSCSEAFIQSTRSSDNYRPQRYGDEWRTQFDGSFVFHCNVLLKDRSSSVLVCWNASKVYDKFISSGEIEDFDIRSCADALNSKGQDRKKEPTVSTTTTILRPVVPSRIIIPSPFSNRATRDLWECVNDRLSNIVIRNRGNLDNFTNEAILESTVCGFLHEHAIRLTSPSNLSTDTEACFQQATTNARNRQRFLDRTSLVDVGNELALIAFSYAYCGAFVE